MLGLDGVWYHVSCTCVHLLDSTAAFHKEVIVQFGDAPLLVRIASVSNEIS